MLLLILCLILRMLPKTTEIYTLSLLGMLLDKLESEMKENLEKSDYLADLMKVLKAVRTLHEKNGTVQELLERQIANRAKLIASMTNAGTLAGSCKVRLLP